MSDAAKTGSRSTPGKRTDVMALLVTARLTDGLCTLKSKQIPLLLVYARGHFGLEEETGGGCVLLYVVICSHLAAIAVDRCLREVILAPLNHANTRC